jgi:hypothetical protein
MAAVEAGAELSRQAKRDLQSQRTFGAVRDGNKNYSHVCVIQFGLIPIGLDITRVYCGDVCSRVKAEINTWPGAMA